MNIKEMLAQRKQLLEESKAIQAAADKEERDLTDDEELDIAGKLEEASGLVSKIDAARETQKRQAALRSQLTAADDWEGQPQASPVRVVLPNTDGASMPNIVGGEASGQFSHFGEYLFKVREAAVTPFAADERLSPMAAAPGMRTDVDSLGGFLIPDQFSDRILEKMYNTGELLNRVKSDGFYTSLSGNTIKLPRVDESSRADGSRAGGVRGYWVGETNSLTDSKPKVGEMTLTLHKAAALGYVTDEMLEDATATGAFLERLLTQELIFTVENAIVNGDGSNKPLGLIAANCGIEVTKMTNQTADTVWGDNLTAMWARMFAPLRSTSVWLVNQSVEPFLFSATLAGRFGSETTAVDGIPLYYPAGSLLNQGKYGILMGRPVIPVEYTKAVGTVGDIILWDPASYVLVDKAGGPQSASSIHVQFLTNQTTFRVTYRVDGQPTWDTPLTPNDAGDTLSPIVKLAAR